MITEQGVMKLKGAYFGIQHSLFDIRYSIFVIRTPRIVHPAFT